MNEKKKLRDYQKDYQKIYNAVKKLNNKITNDKLWKTLNPNPVGKIFKPKT